MSDNQVRSGEGGEARAERGASINELLDRAVPDVWDLADDFAVALHELLTAAA